MTTDTVLTDVEIGACICRAYDESNAREIGELRLYSHIAPIGRAIEQAVLQSYDSQLLRLLVDIRFAAGDDGKRMQDELVEHIKELKKDADRWRFARDLLSVDDIQTAVEKMRGFTIDPDESAKADAAIDAAMEKQL